MCPPCLGGMREMFATVWAKSNHNKKLAADQQTTINTELLDKPYIFSPRQDGIVTQKIKGWAPQQNHIHNLVQNHLEVVSPPSQKFTWFLKITHQK